MCWTITMPGISAGRRFRTSRVASVPPVEAPRPMMVRSRSERPPTPAGETEDREGAAGETAARRRTLAQEATTIFWARESRKDCLLSVPSGFRTKSTAPAARASKTLRFRDETRITGRGVTGSSSLRKSIPLVPGISTSRVITSGARLEIFPLASKALTA